MTLKKPDGNKRCLAPCPKDQPCECRDYIDCIERQSSEIDELKAWKESALSVMNKLDLQAIGKEIGAPLGSDIARQILPAIRALIKANKKLEYLESDNAGLRERVKELEAIVGETYEPSKYNDGFLQWVDKYFAVKPRVQWFISMSTGRRSTIQEIERQYERAMLESPLIKSK